MTDPYASAIATMRGWLTNQGIHPDAPTGRTDYDTSGPDEYDWHVYGDDADRMQGRYDGWVEL